MAFIKEIQARCSSCGENHTISTYGSINVSEDPLLKEKVKDGSLFVWECPHCGQLNLAKYTTLYHDPDGKLMVWLLPLGESLDPGTENGMANIAEELDDYTLRRVDDIGSLIEKVNIFDAGLDDIIIEMCKYVTKMELVEKTPQKRAEIMAAPFKFYRMGGADNEITLSFPMDGNMHGVNIGFNVYEDCSGILRRNPTIKPKRGFARIDSAWLGKFFR